MKSSIVGVILCAVIFSGSAMATEKTKRDKELFELWDIIYLCVTANEKTPQYMTFDTKFFCTTQKMLLDMYFTEKGDNPSEIERKKDKWIEKNKEEMYWLLKSIRTFDASEVYRRLIGYKIDKKK